MDIPRYELVDSLYNWTIIGRFPVVHIRGRSCALNHTVTTSSVYGCDPFHHYVWCCDGSVYMLQWSDGDAKTWSFLTAHIPVLPMQRVPSWLPGQLNWNRHFVSSNQSSRLLTEMPDEMVCRVLSFLPKSSWASAMLVSKRFYRCGLETFLPNTKAEELLTQSIKQASHPNSIRLFVRKIGASQANIVTRRAFIHGGINIISPILDAKFVTAKTVKAMVKSACFTKEELTNALNQIMVEGATSEIIVDICVELAKKYQLDTHIDTIFQDGGRPCVLHNRRLTSAASANCQINTLRLIQSKSPFYVTPIDQQIKHKNFTMIQTFSVNELLNTEQRRYILKWACKFPSRAFTLVTELLTKDCGDLNSVKQSVETLAKNSQNVNDQRAEQYARVLSLITSKIASEVPPAL